MTIISVGHLQMSCGRQDTMSIQCLMISYIAPGDHEFGMRRGCWSHIINSHIPIGLDQAKDAAGRTGRPQAVQGLF